MSDYWKIRERIIQASQDQDDQELKSLAKSHPSVFMQVVNQAKGKRRGLKKGKR